ncbi:hypothetical protein TNCV_1609141 [Trichonephila clavipes]|nr:hypothetical protein TNCV_1609141 [Trichonephila clavipes]
MRERISYPKLRSLPSTKSQHQANDNTRQRTEESELDSSSLCNTAAERISCTSSRSMLTLPEKALLLKLYYQNGECASAALRSYRHTKG